MCEMCEKRIDAMNPKLIEMIIQFEGKYRALEKEVCAAFTELNPVNVLDRHNGDEPVNINDLDQKDIDEMQTCIKNMNSMMGMGFLFGWFSVSEIPSKDEAIEYMEPTMHALNEGINNSFAMNYVKSRAQH